MVLGCGQPHGAQGHNIARVAALRAGLPVTTPGVTVNRFCNSGLQAIVQAAHMVLQEGAEAAIGGGVESITMMQRDGSPNPWVKEQHPGVYMAMGDTAEIVAKRYNVTREAQDELSLLSQQRIAAAQERGFFAGEIAPIDVTRAILDKKTGEKIGEEAVHRRPRRVQPRRYNARGPGEAAGRCSTRRAVAAASPPAIPRSCPMARRPRSSCRRRAPRRWGCQPLLVFRGYAVAACEPDEMGIGPVFAVPKLLKKHGLTVDDIDLWELNEAFASQVVYCRDRLGIPNDRLNVNGGSIAIGHPFGMTGSRLVGTLASEMARRKARYGVVTMCVGGGQGAAALFERA